MNKPPNIPATATWNEEEKCWEDGPRVGSYVRTGAWSGWRADGTLYWTARYGTGHNTGYLHGQLIYFDPAGKPAKIEKWKQGDRVSSKRVGTAKGPKPKKPKSGYEAVMQLDAELRVAGDRDKRRVAWKKVKASELAAVEKKLGVKLPPSYKELVIKHGLFVISDRDKDSYIKGGYYRLLEPKEIVTATLGVRRHCRGEDDEKLVNDLVMFQANPYYESDLFGFVVSSRKKDGEMGVGEWNHDDDNRKPRGFRSFDAHLIQLCKKVIDEDL
jgi:hypothetical protein